MAREFVVRGRTLLVHESLDTCDPFTGYALTGAWLWDASPRLADFISADPRVHLAGKCVFELGAGTGLPGLAAAVLGARSVVLTDLPPLLPTLRRNVEVNGLGDNVKVRGLRWGSVEDEGDDGLLAEADVVLLSDVFYDPSEMQGLAVTLRRLCREGSEVWAASEVREGLEECLQVLVAEGLRVEEVAVVGRGRTGADAEEEESTQFMIFSLEVPSLCEDKTAEDI